MEERVGDLTILSDPSHRDIRVETVPIDVAALERLGPDESMPEIWLG